MDLYRYRGSSASIIRQELKELHKEVKQLSGEVAQVKEKTIAEEIVFPPPVL